MSRVERTDCRCCKWLFLGLMRTANTSSASFPTIQKCTFGCMNSFNQIGLISIKQPICSKNIISQMLHPPKLPRSIPPISSHTYTHQTMPSYLSLHRPAALRPSHPSALLVLSPALLKSNCSGLFWCSTSHGKIRPTQAATCSSQLTSSPAYFLLSYSTPLRATPNFAPLSEYLQMTPDIFGGYRSCWSRLVEEQRSAVILCNCYVCGLALPIVGVRGLLHSRKACKGPIKESGL